MNEWSIEQMLALLKQWRDENDKVPRAKDFDVDMSGRYPPAILYVDTFGNWTNALLAAGMARTSGSHVKRMREHPPIMSIDEIVSSLD